MWATSLPASLSRDIHPGVAVRTNPHGIKLVILHYSADPGKGNGEKTLVPKIGLALCLAN